MKNNTVEIVDGKPLFCVSNADELDALIESYEGELDAPYAVCIPKEAKVIADEAFCDCQALGSVVIEKGVKEIGYSAFSGCTSLQSIEIADSITTIGEDAFMDCKSLKKVFIPKGVKSIGLTSFAYCKSLESIQVEEGNAVYDSRNDCNAIIDTADEMVIAKCSKTTLPEDLPKFRFSFQLVAPGCLMDYRLCDEDDEELKTVLSCEGVTRPEKVAIFKLFRKYMQEGKVYYDLEGRHFFEWLAHSDFCTKKSVASFPGRVDPYSGRILKGIFGKDAVVHTNNDAIRQLEEQEQEYAIVARCWLRTATLDSDINDSNKATLVGRYIPRKMRAELMTDGHPFLDMSDAASDFTYDEEPLDIGYTLFDACEPKLLVFKKNKETNSFELLKDFDVTLFGKFRQDQINS